MNKNILDQTGVYIAFPTSPVLKSIYKAKNYKTVVNNNHTKVGTAADSFRRRERGYKSNFDEEVVFSPVAIMRIESAKAVDDMLLPALRRYYRNVGYSRDWFETTDHVRFKEIIRETLANSAMSHTFIG